MADREAGKESQTTAGPKPAQTLQALQDLIEYHEQVGSAVREAYIAQTWRVKELELALRRFLEMHAADCEPRECGCGPCDQARTALLSPREKASEGNPK